MRALIVKVAFGLIGVAVALGATGSAWAQDGTEERLRAMEERLQRQEREIRELREALAGQKSEDDSLQAELDRYLAKAEDEPWWQEPNTLRAYWDRGIRLATSDGAFKLKIGGRIMYDTAFYDPDSQYEDDFPEIRGMSHLNEFRRARIYFQGTIHENVYFKMQYDFAKGDAGFRDMYIGLQKLPIVGHFQVGNMKEPFSLEEISSSKYITFMERAMAVEAFAPSRHSGFMFWNDELDGQLFWGLGLFSNNNGRGVGLTGRNITARIAGAPLYEDKGGQVLHVGLAYSRRYTDGDMWEFEARPEAHTSPVKYSSIEFEADSADQLAFELAGVFGSFSFQGEYFWTSMNDTALGDDPTFTGYYLYASYFITGEKRKYNNKAFHDFGRVSPGANFWDGDGGAGAWEVGLRYSAIDLRDTGAFDAGDEADNWTLGLNWYWNPNTRFMVNYVYSDVNDGGRVSIVEFRFQIDF